MACRTKQTEAVVLNRTHFRAVGCEDSGGDGNADSDEDNDASDDDDFGVIISPFFLCVSFFKLLENIGSNSKARDLQSKRSQRARSSACGC